MNPFEKLARGWPCLLALLVGCMSASMKSTPFYNGPMGTYTGRAEDRVNLWPIAYYREPALSVLWPLYSQGDDHLALRPIYSQFRQGGVGSDYDEFNFLWPFCQFDARHRSCRIFPVFHYSPDMTYVFPVGWAGGKTCWCIPLFLKDGRDFFSPLYTTFNNGSGDSWMIPPILSWGANRVGTSYASYLLGIFGYARVDGHMTRQWAMPFYYFDKDRDCTALWCRWRDGETGEDSWAFPPALTWGKYGEAGWSMRFLLGLGGATREKHGDSTDWLLPIYHRKNDSFLTPVYGYHKDGAYATRSVPALLSWMSRSDHETRLRFLLGLVGADLTDDGGLRDNWALPLYYKGHRTFHSLLFGHAANDFTYITPLVGVTHRAHEKGGWLWPLFGWWTDDRMKKMENLMAADRLDSDNDLTFAYEESWLLAWLCTGERRICLNTYENHPLEMTDRSEFGNVFAYKSKRCRRVAFDGQTREKISDSEVSEAGVLCNFLWHYENRDGDVAVDAFPYFTYDAKTNGYSKTSFCWRLFRNEYDPETDRRSVDFLFVPIWR